MDEDDIRTSNTCITQRKCAPLTSSRHHLSYDDCLSSLWGEIIMGTHVGVTPELYAISSCHRCGPNWFEARKSVAGAVDA